MSSSAPDAVAEHTLGFVLDPATTALAVIDLQYASACRSTGFGRWLADQGRATEGDYRFGRIEELVVPNTARLLALFREHDLPRIFVRLGAQMGRCRDLIPQIRALEADFGNIEGNREFEFLDEVAPLQGELVLTKLSASAFSSTGIDALLRNLEVRAVVFAGVSTSQCVDLTARDAADRGYRSLVVEDAVAEDRADFHDWTLEQFRRLFGRVETADTVIAELAAALRNR